VSAVWPYLAAILPTILVAILFYFLIKSMIEGDRRERLAQSQYEAQQRRREAAETAGEPAADGTGDAPANHPDNP